MDFVTTSLVSIGLERGNDIDANGGFSEQSDFNKDIFICVPKMNKGLAGVERHEVEDTLRDEVEEYVWTRRGKKLPGFVNYRTFENIVKKHIEELEEPALKLLKDVTDYF